MLRCCANICSGYQEVRDAKYEEEKQARRAARKPRQAAVVQPARRLDVPEDEDLDAAAAFLRLTAEQHGMLHAPPGEDPVGALVSPEFLRNPARLLVILPAAGTELGAFEPGSGPRRAAVPLLEWAQANSYAAALFSGSLLAQRPGLLDDVLKANPSKRVTVLVARGALPSLLAALEPLNAILYARMASICIQPDDGVSADAAVAVITGATKVPVDLATHLRSALVQLPAEWDDLDAHTMRQSLFMLLAERELRWQEGEAMKFAGLSGLKENDLPGFKRMPISKRLERLDRDRGSDELAQLIDSNMDNFTGGQGAAAKALAPQRKDDDDEPGVD